MAKPSDQPVNNLTSRLRQAAERSSAEPTSGNGATAWTTTVPTAPPPVYHPMPSSPSGGGGSRTAVIVAAIVGAVVVLPLLAIAAITLLGRSATDEFEGVDAPASTVFQPISGYTMRPAPQADLDQVRSVVEMRTPAGSLDSVDGRLVYKDGKAVAEAIVTIFNPDVAFDADAAIDGFAATLSSHEEITIAGSKALYGKASNGAEVVAVYEGHTGLVVAGSGRAQLEDVASKLVANM